MDIISLYTCSNLGRIKSLERFDYSTRKIKERIIKQQLGRNGYFMVLLSINGSTKGYTTHQLVAITFLNHIPNGKRSLIVDHIDECKTNNALDNLQLINVKKNTIKSIIHKTNKTIGVSFVKKYRNWRSVITLNNKTIHLGCFNSECEAEKVYRAAIKNYNKELFKTPFSLNKSSKYSGVSWSKEKQKWRAIKNVKRKQVFLGYYNNEEEAYNSVLEFINKSE